MISVWFADRVCTHQQGFFKSCQERLWRSTDRLWCTQSNHTSNHLPDSVSRYTQGQIVIFRIFYVMNCLCLSLFFSLYVHGERNISPKENPCWNVTNTGILDDNLYNTCSSSLPNNHSELISLFHCIRSKFLNMPTEQ